MNSTPPPPPPPAGTSFFRSVRGMGIWRAQDRWAAGVAGGLAHRLGIDPLIVRGLFVVATLFGGLGLILYGLGWMLLPEAADGRIHLEEAFRGRFDIALAGAITVTIIGMTRPILWWQGSWWAVPWIVALAAIIAVIILADRQKNTPPPAANPTVAAGPPRPAYDVPEDTVTQQTDSPSVPAETETLPASAAGYESAPTTEQSAPATEQPAYAGHEPAPTAGQPDWDQPAHGGWGGGWDGGSGTPPAGPPAGPPAPPRPPVPGPGSRLTSLVMALALLATAAIVGAHQVGAVTGNVWLIAGGAVLVILGAGIVISGIRGRNQGGLGGLALVLAIILVPTAGISSAIPGIYRAGTNTSIVTGDRLWAPTDAAEAEDGYAMLAGELVVDLADLEEDANLQAAVTFGNLHLLVPDDVEVTVHSRVAAGEVVGRLDDGWSGPGTGRASGRADQTLSNGTGINITLTQDGAATGPQIVVDAEVTFGQIIIEETS